jgi:hypothetical protein
MEITGQFKLRSRLPLLFPAIKKIIFVFKNYVKETQKGGIAKPVKNI